MVSIGYAAAMAYLFLRISRCGDYFGYLLAHLRVPLLLLAVALIACFFSGRFMKDFLTEQGFHAFTLRASAEQVEEQLRKRRPVIVGFGHGSASDLHFVVVSGFDRKSFWLHDPARKEPKRLKRKKFQKLWEGGDGWTLIAVPQ